MLRAILWLLWGCIAWIDTRFSYRRRKGPRKPTLRDRLRAPFSRVSSGWAAITAGVVRRSRSWAEGKENPDIRGYREYVIGRLTPRHRFASTSIINVYEMLRLYLLSNQWTPCIQHFRLGLAFLGTSLSALLATSFLTTTQMDLNRVPNWAAVSMLICALGTLAVAVFVLSSALKHASKPDKVILIFVVCVFLGIWFGNVIQIPSERSLGLRDFAILGVLCLAGLLSLLSMFAYLLQWRLLRLSDAVANWMAAAISSEQRQIMISRLCAWILHMAPTADGATGWQSDKESIRFLQEASRVEREGAEWRSLILTIVALFGLSNLARLIPGVESHDLPVLTSITIISSLANPAMIMGIMVMVMVAWGVLAEIWLSEFPNQIVGLACVQALHWVETTKDRNSREFENCRIITASNPDNLSVGQQSQWRLIASAKQADGTWRCLVEVLPMESVPGP